MNTPQFDLSAMLSTPQQTAVQQIPCDKLHPYHNHKFELYSGERLEDMVASIKENGVLSPIIVQPDGDGYEILIGHNRWNASKLAGLSTVPVDHQGRAHRGRSRNVCHRVECYAERL